MKSSHVLHYWITMLPCHACPSLWIDAAYISILQYRSVWHVSQNPLTLHALHACKGAKCKAMFLKHTDCSANDTHVKMPSCSKRPPLLWGSPRPSSVSATACSAVELLCTRLGLPTNAKVPKAAAKSARGTARDMILSWGPFVFTESLLNKILFVPLANWAKAPAM